MSAHSCLRPYVVDRAVLGLDAINIEFISKYRCLSFLLLLPQNCNLPGEKHFIVLLFVQTASRGALQFNLGNTFPPSVDILFEISVINSSKSG